VRALLDIHCIFFSESATLSQTITTAEADFNSDDHVSFSNFLAFGNITPRFGLNFSGIVKFPDFLLFISLFEERVKSGQILKLRIEGTSR